MRRTVSLRAVMALLIAVVGLIGLTKGIVYAVGPPPPALPLSLTINTSGLSASSGVRGSSISETINVTAANGNGVTNRWGSSKFTVGADVQTCQVTSPTATADSTVDRSFTITAPSTAGTYAVSITVYEKNDCTTTGGKVSATKSLGNLTVSGSKTINPHADVIAEATSASGAVVTYTNATTTDSIDGSGTANCTPVSGSLFPLGDTTVTCTADDSAGNAAAPVTFKVTVQDKTIPVIDSHANIFVEAEGPGGTTVDYESPATTDAVDGDGTANCSPVSGSLFAMGVTTVECNATDSAGNEAEPVYFFVFVEDTTAPTFTINLITPSTNANIGSPITVATTDADDAVGPLTYLWEQVGGSDLSFGHNDQPITDVSAQKAGIYTIRLTLFDGAGNNSSKEVTLTFTAPTVPVTTPRQEAIKPALAFLNNNRSSRVANQNTPRAGIGEALKTEKTNEEKTSDVKASTTTKSKNVWPWILLGIGAIAAFAYYRLRQNNKN